MTSHSSKSLTLLPCTGKWKLRHCCMAQLTIQPPLFPAMPRQRMEFMVCSCLWSAAVCLIACQSTSTYLHVRDFLAGNLQVITEYSDEQLPMVLEATEKLEAHLTAAVVSNDAQFTQKVISLELVLARTHGLHRIMLSMLEGLAHSAFICTSSCAHVSSMCACERHVSTVLPELQRSQLVRHILKSLRLHCAPVSTSLHRCCTACCSGGFYSTCAMGCIIQISS